MGRQDSQVNAAGVGRIRDHLCRISTQYMPAGCKSLAPKLIRLGLDELLRIFVLQFEESGCCSGGQATRSPGLSGKRAETGNHDCKVQRGIAGLGNLSCNRQGLGVVGFAIQGNEDIAAGKKRGAALLIGMGNQDWKRAQADDPLGDATQEQVQ